MTATMRCADEHRADDVAKLAFKRVPADVDRLLMLQQVEGRQLAQTKLPEWSSTPGIVYPPRVSMEQCSSQSTALLKADLVIGDSLVDLTGGLGVDFSYMSRKVSRATYVERDTRLAALANHNFAALSLKGVTVVNDSAESFVKTMSPVDTVFVDPSRRDINGKRFFAIADCEPDMTTLAPQLLSVAKRVIVKLSPMLDITAALRVLPPVSRVIVVGVKNECKELLIVMDRDRSSSPVVECVADDRRFSYSMDDPSPAIVYWKGDLKSCPYLYDPDATLMKVGCHARVAARFGLSIVADNSHLMLGDRVADDFPGRVFRLIGIVSASVASLSALKRANVAVRNFNMTAVQLRDRLKLKDGGDTYIFGTTTAKGKRVLLMATPLD